ncbi:MAG: hypothetical protein CMC70_05035 [Flavobacteriaceae bacterium]|nr:hypothetical protein [Flavobacteriaceae bacterium]
MIRFFLKIHHFLQQQKLVFWAGLVVVFGILGLAASTIQFEEDIAKLIPTSTENEQLQKVLETANFSDKIIVHIQKSEKGTTENLTNYATRFLDSLQQNFEGYIKDVQGNVQEETALETLDFVYENLPLFLTEKDYKTITQKLNPDSIAAITKQNYNTLVSPTGLVAKKTIARDPLGLSLLGIQNFKKLGISDAFKLENGYLVSKDNNHLLLFITPAYATSETDKNEVFVTNLYKLQSQLNKQYKVSVKANYYGAAFIAVANAKQIKSDIQFTVGLALVMLLLVFIFFYRKLTVPIILVVPTLFGALVSVGFLAFFRGEISAISLGIGSVLLGITLDYSLHILTHIRNGETPQQLFQNVVSPILMSSLTTALAFLCLLFINSQALQDLGIFAALSVLGAAVFSLIFIPQVYKGSTHSRQKTTLLDAFAKYPFHKSKILIGCILLALLVSIFTYNKVVFNKDISELNYVPDSLLDAEKELDTLLNTQSKTLYVAAYGNSIEQALEANDLVFEELLQLEGNNSIISFNSIASLVASKNKQQRQIDKWNQTWDDSKTDSVVQMLRENGMSSGFTPASFQQFYALLEKEFKPLKLSEFKSMNILAIDDFIATKDQFTTVTSLVKVDGADLENVKKAFKDNKNIQVIDRTAINETLLGNLQNDFSTLVLYSFGVVLLLLLGYYRNWKLTLITIVPIVLTWFVTLGIMGVFGLQFNIFNIIVTTFIFGLGVDYSIFMTNALQKRNHHQKALLTTHKTSIVLSVLTTILGVGALIFAKHPALQSIAAVAVVGILSAMVISFTIQPLLFHFLIFRSTNKMNT